MGSSIILGANQFAKQSKEVYHETKQIKNKEKKKDRNLLYLCYHLSLTEIFMPIHLFRAN